MALGDFLFPHVELKLVIVRSFESDIESVKDKFSEEYRVATARINLSKSDLQRLGLKDGKEAGVKSAVGTVIVRAYVDSKAKEGVATMPYGPWALTLVAVPSDDAPPQLHGIKVTITRSEAPITSLEEILDS